MLAGCNADRSVLVADVLTADVAVDAEHAAHSDLPTPEPVGGHVVPSELEPRPRAVFDTLPLGVDRLGVSWVHRTGTEECPECDSDPSACHEECLIDHLMFTQVDEWGIPVDEFEVRAHAPPTIDAGISGAAADVGPDGFVLTWRECEGQTCRGWLQSWSDQGVPTGPRVLIYDARVGRLHLAVDQGTGYALVVTSRARFGGREAATGVGAAVVDAATGQWISEWRMLGSAGAGSASVSAIDGEFAVAFTDPAPASASVDCPFCESLPCVRDGCDSRNNDSLDVAVVVLDPDSVERSRFVAIREPDGHPVPIWDDIEVSISRDDLIVARVVGWGAQTEGLVDPGDMGLWNPGVTIVSVNREPGPAWGRVDPLVETSGVSFGVTLDPESPGTRWVLHDSVVAPGGLDENVVAFTETEVVHSETHLTNAFTERGTASVLETGDGRYVVGYARDLLNQLPSFVFYRGPVE